MVNAISMNQILGAKLGEQGSEIRATFRKTINIKQYESEVIELESVLKVDEELSGAERMLLTALLQAQLEYSAYVQLVMKKLVSEEDFYARKEALEQEITRIKAKVEEVTGRTMDKYI